MDHPAEFREEVKIVLNAKAFAKAATAVTAVFYVICALLSYISPDFVFGLAKSWVHTLNMDAAKVSFAPDLGTLIYGIVTISVITWITTYALIWLYNRWAK